MAKQSIYGRKNIRIKNELARELIKSLSVISIVILLRQHSETGSAFQLNAQLTCTCVSDVCMRAEKERKKLRSTFATWEYEASVRLKAELINSRTV